MTEHGFQLAAALLSDAADRLLDTAAGTTVIQDHAYGCVQLVATHDVGTAGGHTLVLWAAHRDRVLAAVEARTTAPESAPATRVLTFRAEHLVFTNHGDFSYAAAGVHRYALVAHIGSSAWDLTVDDANTITCADLDAALTELFVLHELIRTAR
jgi:hypothetical protein